MPFVLKIFDIENNTGKKIATYTNYKTRSN